MLLYLTEKTELECCIDEDMLGLRASPLETKNSSEEGVESSPGSPRLDGDEMERKKKALFAKLARKGKL